MQNIEIRKAIRTSDLRHWEIAKAMGINEATFSRWLRTELPNEKKEQIMSIIQNYKGGE